MIQFTLPKHIKLISFKDNVFTFKIEFEFPAKILGWKLEASDGHVRYSSGDRDIIKLSFFAFGPISNSYDLKIKYTKIGSYGERHDRQFMTVVESNGILHERFAVLSEGQSNMPSETIAPSVMWSNKRSTINTDIANAVSSFNTFYNCQIMKENGNQIPFKNILEDMKNFNPTQPQNDQESKRILRDRIKNLEKEKAHLESIVKSCNKGTVGLAEEHVKLNEDHRKLKHLVKTSNEQKLAAFNRYNKQIEDYKKVIEDYRHKDVTPGTMADVLRVYRENTKNALVIKGLHAELAELSNSNEKMSDELTKKDAMIHELQNDLRVNAEAESIRLEMYEKQCEEARKDEKIEDLYGQIEVLKYRAEQNICCHVDIRTAEKIKEEHLKAINGQVEEYNKMVTEKDAKIAGLENELDACKKNHDSILTSCNDHHRLWYSKSQEEVQKFKNVNSLLNQELNMVQHERTMLTVGIEAAKKDNAALVKQCCDHLDASKDQVVAYNQMVIEKDTKYSDLMRYTQELTKKYNEVKEKYDDLLSKYNSSLTRTREDVTAQYTPASDKYFCGCDPIEPTYSGSPGSLFSDASKLRVYKLKSFERPVCPGSAEDIVDRTLRPYNGGLFYLNNYKDLLRKDLVSMVCALRAKPWLGNATNAQILNEIEARMKNRNWFSEGWNYWYIKFAEPLNKKCIQLDYKRS